MYTKTCSLESMNVFGFLEQMFLELVSSRSSDSQQSWGLEV
jgi:hypothetical protein